jgi:hypothetical protein
VPQIAKPTAVRADIDGIRQGAVSPTYGPRHLAVRVSAKSEMVSKQFAEMVRSGRLVVAAACYQISPIMPILPLDHPEPFAATLGVMLYPGTDNDDPLMARAFAARWLAVPLRRFHDASYQLSYEALAQIAEDGGDVLNDVDKRWWGGTATGELFKAVWALFNTKSKLATWNNAVKIAKLTTPPDKARSSRGALWAARSPFLSVAHLWGAWSIRGYQFKTDPDAKYDGWDDFQSFLAEAEILRDFGQTWLPARAKGKPLLPADVWHVPASWAPPKRQPGWPETGQIPILTLPADLVAKLKSAGRPAKHG